MKKPDEQANRCAYWGENGCVLGDVSLSDGDKLMSEKETAGYLRCEPKTLENRRYSGDGPPFFRTKPVIYRRRDVDAWLAARKVTPQLIATTQRTGQLIPRLEVPRKSSGANPKTNLPSDNEVVNDEL